MSDLFRSALGYLSGPSPAAGGPASAAGGQQGHGGYSSASGGPSDDTNAIGEVIAFSFQSKQRNVRILKLIAEGGFSYVFRGVDTTSGEFVAVKKILAPDPEAVKGVDQEVEFMRQFQHEHIVQFFGSFMKSSKNLKEYYLGMEYCPVPLPTPPFRLQHTTQVFAQTCRAIKYLHEFGIIHRDIKLENLLIGSDGLVKLVDFGSATMDKIYPTADWSMNKRTIVEEQIAAKTTPMYRAPEMLDLWSNYPIDEHVDMWALGCLLFALNFGQHPFQDSNKLAIVNANYSIPKNISDSGPIVSVIRGLLKVDPAERLSFGQILEVLSSIAESSGFALNGQLPFKAVSSPNTTGSGIVNPLGSAASNPPPVPPTPNSQSYLAQSQQPGQAGYSSSGSLFSSLKGGAVSLIKNIKEQSQQYLTGPVPPSSSGPQSNNNGNNVPPPSRPAPPSISAPLSTTNRPPPPRPAPPSPNTQRKEAAAGHIEFENREYEMMQQQHHQPVPQRPAPPKPPPPKTTHEPHPPKVANLLDISFDSPSVQPASNTSNQNSSNTDLLGDLFGSSSSAAANNFNASSNLNDDLLWTNSGLAKDFSNNSGFQNNGGLGFNSSQAKGQSDVGDLLGNPLSSILGTSAPTSIPSRPSQPPTVAFGSSQPLLQPSSNSSIPSSASFQNLNTNGRDPSNGFGSGLLDTGASKIPKNSSSPNLLSDLILDDIMGIGGGVNKINIGQTAPSVNKSNPALNQVGPSPASVPVMGPSVANSSRPNYNRTLFEPPVTAQSSDKKTVLDDVFADILNSQGFAANNKMDAGKTINDLRKIEMLSNPNMNPTQLKVNDWREGKKKNIRALLSSLHTVTWEGCHWEETNMSQMITPAQVKKTYRKACLAIHPDKQMGEEWEELAKLIFVELNEAWAAFEESQQGI